MARRPKRGGREIGIQSLLSSVDYGNVVITKKLKKGKPRPRSKRIKNEENQPGIEWCERLDGKALRGIYTAVESILALDLKTISLFYNTYSILCTYTLYQTEYTTSTTRMWVYISYIYTVRNMVGRYIYIINGMALYIYKYITFQTFLNASEDFITYQCWPCTLYHRLFRIRFIRLGA